MASHWQNKLILITGAGSGIGQALAKRLAKQGARLIITDQHKDTLDQTCLSIPGQVALAKAADASKLEDWQALSAEIESKFGHLDVLVNNAGMSSFGYFDETDSSLFDKVMAVNFNGVVIGCREMLPLLAQAERGMIVNVASVFGLITMPMMTPYHASKFAVRGFTEALKQDLAFQGKNIDVICVMPGAIRTNIANYAEMSSNDEQASDSQAALKQHFAKQLEKFSMTSADKAAAVIEKGMRNNTFRVLIGADARVIDLLYKALPTDYPKVSNFLLGVNKLLKH